MKIKSKDFQLSVGQVPVREPDQPRRSLNPARRKQLEEIRKKEEIRVKRDKVAALLTRKLVLKIGR